MLVRTAFVSSAALMSVTSVTRPAALASSATRPAAIIFDLDGCLWYPDMYMLWGGGAPFSKAAAGTDLTDVRGAKVRMIGAVPEGPFLVKVGLSINSEKTSQYLIGKH